MKSSPHYQVSSDSDYNYFDILYAGMINVYAAPVPTDSRLSIERIYERDFIPSSMSFVGPSDLLVT